MVLLIRVSDKVRYSVVFVIDLYLCGRCRQTETPMPQVVLAHPSWSSVENSFCSVRFNSSTLENSQNVSVVTGAVYIKAVMDHKYDGIQVRDLTVLMVRRRRVSDDDEDVETLREAVLQLPVCVQKC